MTKFVCAGTFVTSKDKKNGVVISTDNKTRVAVISNGDKIWTDKIQNLQVTSYKGV